MSWSNKWKVRLALSCGEVFQTCCTLKECVWQIRKKRLSATFHCTRAMMLIKLGSNFCPTGHHFLLKNVMHLSAYFQSIAKTPRQNSAIEPERSHTCPSNIDARNFEMIFPVKFLQGWRACIRRSCGYWESTRSIYPGRDAVYPRPVVSPRWREAGAADAGSRLQGTGTTGLEKSSKCLRQREKRPVPEWQALRGLNLSF